jgi:hypothetical protein
MRRVSRESSYYSREGASIHNEEPGDILLFQVGLVHSFVAHRTTTQGGLLVRGSVLSLSFVEPHKPDESDHYHVPGKRSWGSFISLACKLKVQIPQAASRFIQSFGVSFRLVQTYNFYG